jgi:Protein of unknown function (DUF732)
LAVLLALAGCGGAGGLSGPVRQRFLNAVYSQAPGVGGYRTGAQLVAMGQAVCTDFESGAGVQQVADRVPLFEGSVALPAPDLGVVMSAAVTHICPQYRSLLGQ